MNLLVLHPDVLLQFPDPPLVRRLAVTAAAAAIAEPAAIDGTSRERAAAAAGAARGGWESRVLQLLLQSFNVSFKLLVLFLGPFQLPFNV